MNREMLEKFIAEQYGVEAEHPWADTPEHAVFRHAGNRKWFAIAMNIPKSRLGITGEGMIDIVNVKCGPALSGALRTEKGFFPAYHMNKTHWISIALDGSAEEEQLLWMLDNSFRLTGEKGK